MIAMELSGTRKLASIGAFGLVVTFGGIGLVVNIILIYIAIQVRGERHQNQERLQSQRQR